MSAGNKSFLDQVETLLKKLAPDKGLRVWRGQGSGFLFPKEREFEVVVLYLSSRDSGGPSGKVYPELSAMAVGLDGEAMKIKADNYTGFMPFGGGHDLIGNVRDACARLPSFTDD